MAWEDSELVRAGGGLAEPDSATVVVLRDRFWFFLASRLFWKHCQEQNNNRAKGNWRTCGPLSVVAGFHAFSSFLNGRLAEEWSAC